MKTKSTLLVAFSLATLFFSCKKDSPVLIDYTNDGTFKVFTEGNITTVQNLIADTILGIDPVSQQPYASGKFTFFSLETRSVVPSIDSLTTKWDIAFRGTTILTNSGVSGPGVGGGFVQSGTFEGLTLISADSVFRTDSVLTPTRRYAITSGSDKGWYNYDGPNNLIKPLPGKVLVFRTASGKYAKMEITNYYKGGVTPDVSASTSDKTSKQRYYNFRFTYQPNGTKNF